MALPSGMINSSYAEDTAIFRTKQQWALLIAGLVLAALLPFLASDYLMSFLLLLGITIISALGLNVLTGYCGQLSIGHAAFMAVGAFTCANLLNHQVDFLLALIAGGIAAGLVGVVFGLPSIRVKGFYLVLSTLAAQFIISYVIIGWFGGDRQVHMQAFRLGNISFTSAKTFWYLVLVTLVALTFFAKNIMRSNTGRAFIAIRDNDIAAEAMGINVVKYKLLAFGIGCFYAGIAGALWSGYVQVAAMEQYSLFDSIWYVGIIIIGGMGSIAGTFFGAIFVRGIKEFAEVLSPMIGGLLPPTSAVAQGITLSLPLFLFGAAVALFLVFEPRGLAHRWELFKAYYRLWPWGYW